MVPGTVKSVNEFIVNNGRRTAVTIVFTVTAKFHRIIMALFNLKAGSIPTTTMTTIAHNAASSSGGLGKECSEEESGEHFSLSVNTESLLEASGIIVLGTNGKKKK